jgi:plastocyanin
MRKRRVLGSAAALLAVLTLATPATGRVSDAGSPAVVSLPGSRSGTYATPVIVVQPGEKVRFINLDLFVHDVRSKVKGPDNVLWCKPADPREPAHPVRNPRRFPKGKCPLLWTPPIALTNGVVDTKLYGTQNLKSGSTIDFFCTVFPEMRGKVIVL